MSVLSEEILVGYIPDNLTLKNTVLSFEPISDLAEVIKSINQSFHIKDGFCFPTSSQVKYAHEVEGEEFVLKEVSRSPNFQPEIFKFYSTHRFKILDGNWAGKLNDFSKNPSFFIMQVVGYVSGYRVMPEGFWYDGKIPCKSTNNISCNNYDPIIHKAIEFWGKVPEPSRNDLLGFFYFFNRSPSYHWHFEKFSHDFMVFESVMKFYIKNISDFKRDRNQKFYNFLDEIKIAYDKNTLQDLIELRNNLFHEIRWGDGVPCFANDSEVIYKTLAFRKMLHAVLGRLIGLDGAYFSSDWNIRGMISFDVV